MAAIKAESGITFHYFRHFHKARTWQLAEKRKLAEIRGTFHLSHCPNKIYD
ncbi:hypothetical protein THTE_3443 [Thermogutta terrifontis]|uniref:Uncharacterized protein n=1 Tax=Thermogutta terrifontis TaxID=1331910 RepID=A0A286RJA0_9BACT|nr:hypothetical protein THTE_3443 [Thermogutta terrifontis]